MGQGLKSGSQKNKSKDVNNSVITKIQNTDINSKQDSIVDIECESVCVVTSESLECDDLAQAAEDDKCEHEI
jgi:lactam utilization protein B